MVFGVPNKKITLQGARHALQARQSLINHPKLISRNKLAPERYAAACKIPAKFALQQIPATTVAHFLSHRLNDYMIRQNLCILAINKCKL